MEEPEIRPVDVGDNEDEYDWEIERRAQRSEDQREAEWEEPPKWKR